LIEFLLFKKKLNSPWASNLPLPIFTNLVTAGFNILKDENFVVKGNDMELFHFSSAGPLVINQAPQKLFQNLSDSAYNVKSFFFHSKVIIFYHITYII
jgi:hypothetical protein